MDFSQIGEQDSATEGGDFRPEPPAMVPFRVLEADADFLAYHNGYQWETESLEKSIESLKLEIETLRIMAGAEQINLHLTMGTKGGRYELAKVKEYQGKREKSEGLAERVSALRHFMANYSNANTSSTVSLDQEADDALCQALIRARDGVYQNLRVLWSLDKDLNMVPGLHMHGRTYDIFHVPDGYGECELDRTSTSSTKVVGYGHSFFWHQMLMGDNADDIPGLPKLSSKIMREIAPTKTLVKAELRLRTANTPAKAKAARVALNKIYDGQKPKACGAVGAHTYLAKCKTNKEAFRLVREAYVEYYGPGSFDFTDWRGQTTRETAGSMLIEQGRLLWMRRYHGEDVMEFFKEVMA